MTDFFKPLWESIGILAKGAAHRAHYAALLLLFAGVILAAWLNLHIAVFIIIVLLAIVLSVIVGALAVLEVSEDSERQETLSNVQIDPSNSLALEAGLSKQERKKMREILASAAREAANALGLNGRFIRSNLFGLDAHNVLRIVDAFTHNMDRDEELTIAMAIGEGSTGRAFQSGRANVAILRENWGADVLVNDEMKKVHPELHWIISLPVLAPDHAPSGCSTSMAYGRPPQRNGFATPIRFYPHLRKRSTTCSRNLD
jgi:hypothetical protein